MKNGKRLAGIMIVLAFMLSSGAYLIAHAAGEMDHGMGNMDMEMHHMHILMNHGLEMIAEGSTLAMLAQMDMSPALDPMTLKHGDMMVKDGKGVIEQVLNGPEMKAMHEAGAGKTPLMTYTHELGSAELTYADMVEKMDMQKPTSPDMMTMHHMHILINHALEMAAQGSNLVMLGEMKMTPALDKSTIEHGKKMLADARSMITMVLEGKAMTDMHKKGITMGNAMMAETHKIGSQATKIIDLLSKMPGTM